MKSLFVVLLALVVCMPAIRAAEPEEVYTEIYAEVEKGDSLLEKGDTAAAHTKYTEAQIALRQLKFDNPGWNTNAVNYRLQYISDKLAETSAKKPSGQAASGATNAAGAKNASGAPAPAQSSEPVEMRIKWQVGKRYDQHMDSTQNTDMAVPGSPQPMKQEMKQTQDVSLTVVKQLEGGGHEVDMEITGMTMTSKMAGQTLMNFDSKKTDDAGNSAALRKVIGMRFKFITDATGKIDRVEGLQEALQKVTAGASPTEQGMIKGMFSEDAFKQMYSPGQGLPDKSVKPGDTWPIKDELSLGPLGSVKVDSHFTFNGWVDHDKRKCVLLEFTGTLTSGASGANVGMEISNGKTTGKIWFDPALGMVVDSNSKESMNLKVTAQGQTLNTKVSSTENNKLVKISDAAQTAPQQ